MSSPCKAIVEFKKEYGGDDDKIFKHKCCLFTPHKGIKHYTPSLLITMGGDRVTHDIHGNDITKTWSPYSNERID